MFRGKQETQRSKHQKRNIGVSVSWGDDRNARTRLEKWRWRDWPSGVQIIASLWGGGLDGLHLQTPRGHSKGNHQHGRIKPSIHNDSKKRMAIPNYVGNDDLGRMIPAGGGGGKNVCHESRERKIQSGGKGTGWRSKMGKQKERMEVVVH